MREEKGRDRPGRWTAEQCIQALELFLDRERRMPHISEQGPKAGLASPETFRKAVGCRYSQYGGRYDESHSNMRWTAEKCAAAVDRFIEKNGRWPKIPSEAVSSLERPAPKTFQRHTGMTMGVYLKNRYPELTTPQKCGRGWTKDRIIAATDHFMKTYGRYPTAEEYSMEYGLPTHNTISAHFGIPAGVYWKQRYPMTEQGWSMDTILQAFEHFIQEHGRLPLIKELHPQNGLPCSQTIAHCAEIKKYSEFCRAYFPEYARQAKWNRERYIQGLEQFLKENGRCPTQEEHKQYE